MPQKVPQKQFSSLEEFIQDQNNFYAYFLKGNPFGEIRREKLHFIRFQHEEPALEKQLSEKVPQEISAGRKLSVKTYELLFIAYAKMSDLVYDDEPAVKRYSHPELYLTA